MIEGRPRGNPHVDLVEADSVEEVLDLAKGCPVLKTGAKSKVFEPFAIDP